MPSSSYQVSGLSDGRPARHYTVHSSDLDSFVKYDRRTMRISSLFHCAISVLFIFLEQETMLANEIVTLDA